ncbi:MAG: hypothetical protein V4445_05790 [Pseudomonadota bacterium]
MKTILKQFANLLTIAATLFFVGSIGNAIVKSLAISDIISEVAFCYLAIAVFNYILFGSATLWYMKKDM